MNFTHDSTEALEGVLWRSRGAWLTLTDVKAITQGQPPQRIPGEVVVHRDQVKFLQVLP